MPSDFDFRGIRTLQGSRHFAFEEFSCQLARRHSEVPHGSTFRRFEGAGGDGGVECTWSLSSGDEWGWQAKYLFRLDLTQLQRSIETALRLHPRLTRYFICIPFDLAPPTARGGKSQVERYDDARATWEAMATTSGMAVEFVLWTRTDLIEELLRIDPSQGRIRFWFGEERLGDEWFHRHLEDVVAAAAPRYTPELNVTVPIAGAFEAFGRTVRWREHLEEIQREVRKAAKVWKYTILGTDINQTGPFPSEAAAEAESLRDGLYQLAERLGTVMSTTVDTISGISSLSDVAEAVKTLLELAGRCRQAAEDQFRGQYGESRLDSVGWRQYMAEYEVKFPAAFVDGAREVLALLERLLEQVSSPMLAVAETPAMLVTGDAGVGKTHAIIDHALCRHASGLRSIVALGEAFTQGPPWESLRVLLGFQADLSRDALLEMLDAAGEASRFPCIIFIDALNEATPRTLWRTSLAAMVQQVSRHSWVRLCVSCRTTYLEEVLPAGLEIPRVEHRGFEEVEFDAFPAFFLHYKLELPSFPILQSEFSNPLFLKLVCESLRDENVRHFPQRMLGLTEVVERLVRAKEAKLADPASLDYDPREGFVQRAVEALVREMQTRGTRWLPWSDAKGLVDALRPASTRSASLFDAMVREGLLTEDRLAARPGELPVDVVRFGFDRLADHLVIAALFAGFSEESIREAFAPGGRAHYLIDGTTEAENRALLEAAAIQLPERFSVELPEVAGDGDGDIFVLEAFARSLPWRSPDSITRATVHWVKKALRTGGVFETMLDSVLSVSARPDHRLNGGWLHDFFTRVSMADRDAAWCQFLFEEDGARRSVDRLIRWARSADIRPISDESVRTWSLALAWFCAASDRRVRDRATKSLVRLLEAHPGACAGLVEMILQDVDDEYVIERVFAAAYGALVRTGETVALRRTAAVMLSAFQEGRIPANAVIRDAARSLLEYALVRSALPAGTDPADFRPPYESPWPVEWPSEEDIEPFEQPDQRRKLPKLLESCLHDDFARYTAGNAVSDYGVSADQAGRWIFFQVLDLGYTSERFANFDGYLLYAFGHGRAKPKWVERVGKKYQWISLFQLIAQLADHVPPTRSEWDPPVPSLPPLQAPSKRGLDPTTLWPAFPTVSGAGVWWSPLTAEDAGIDSPGSDLEWLTNPAFPDSRPLLNVEDSAHGRQWITLETYLSWSAKRNEDDESGGLAPRQLWMHFRSYLVSRADALRCWRWLSKQDFMGRWMPESVDHTQGFVGEWPWGIPFLNGLEEAAWYPQRTEIPVPLEPTAASVIDDWEYDSSGEESRGVLVPSHQFFDHGTLVWDGAAGYRDSTGGKVVLQDPSTAAPGPRALLVDRSWLQDYLARNDLALVWTVLAEKQSFQGHDRLDTYYKFSRAHVLVEGKLRSSRGWVSHGPKPGSSDSLDSAPELTGDTDDPYSL